MTKDEADPRITAEFARRRRRQIIATIPTLGIILLIALSKRDSRPALMGVPADTLFIVAIVGLVAALRFSLWNWRCPSCGKYLGKTTNPSFCIKCGVKLR